MATNKNRHFNNLPHQGTVVTLLDRQSQIARFAIVTQRVGRNGKLRLFFVDGRGNQKKVEVVPNDSKWAMDKTIRYRWSYSPITDPKFADYTPTGTLTGRLPSARKTAWTGPEARA
jgi:hypothetical protein